MSTRMKWLAGIWCLTALVVLSALFVPRSTPEDHPIHHAAAVGDLARVTLLLQDRASLANRRDTTGRTPLHRAAARGNSEIAKALLKAGADSNPRNKAGATPIHWAAGGGFVDVVQVLLEARADANARTRGGGTPLMRAVENGHVEVARVLLARGAFVNARDREGLTAMHFAAKRSQKDLVDALLAYRADVNARSKRGETPLRNAARGRERQRAEYLLAHGARLDIFVAAAWGKTARVESMLRADRSLVHARDEKGRTPLHWAAANAQRETARVLLANGADPNAKNDRGTTPIREVNPYESDNIEDLLLEHGAQIDLFEAVHRGDKQRVETLLKNDPALLAMRAEYGGTPLHAAAGGGQAEITRLLLAKGLDPDVRNDFGDFPLAVAAARGHTEVVEALLSKGADANARDPGGRSALYRAAISNHVDTVALLRRHGAEPDLCEAAAMGDRERVVARLQEQPTLVRLPGIGEQTPLHCAALAGEAGSADALIAAGADVDAGAGGWRLTPLHLAALRGHSACVARLLALDADPTLTADDGRSAAELASDSELRRALEAAGAAARARTGASRGGEREP